MAVRAPVFSPLIKAVRSPVLSRGVVGGGAISGFMFADDYTVATDDVVTLSFRNTSLDGSVTADDYSVAPSDPVMMEFTQ